MLSSYILRQMITKICELRIRPDAGGRIDSGNPNWSLRIQTGFKHFDEGRLRCNIVGNKYRDDNRIHLSRKRN